MQFFPHRPIFTPSYSSSFALFLFDQEFEPASQAIPAGSLDSVSTATVQPTHLTPRVWEAWEKGGNINHGRAGGCVLSQRGQGR